MSLDAPEVRACIARARIALVATRSPRGAPFVTPLWFVVHAGRLLCTTSAASVTVRNVDADGAASVLLYDGVDESATRLLRLRGRATARRGRLPFGVVARMAAKYYASPAGLAVELAHARLWPLRMRYYAQSEAALLDFVPEVAEFVPRPR